MTMNGNPFAGFGISLKVTAGESIVGVRGTVDHLSAAVLRAVIDAVVVQGCRLAVLDLSELDLIETSGLSVIASAARRLAEAGGLLTIRSPRPGISRILDANGLGSMVCREVPGKASGLHEGEPALDLPGTPMRLGSSRLARHLRSVTAIPASYDVVDAALRLVVALAYEIVQGADGASISLWRFGRLVTAAASDQTVSDMDAQQYATGEGPCVGASAEGRSYYTESLASELRWPAFVPRARALGISAILSSPLLAQGRPAGALNLYSHADAAFSSHDRGRASVLAAEASKVLGEVWLDLEDEELSGRLSAALKTRQVISEAQGVIMEREHIGENAAYAVLRRFSLESKRSLVERAEEVVASTRSTLAGKTCTPTASDSGSGSNHG